MQEITAKTLNDIFFPPKTENGEKTKDLSLPIRWDGKDFYKELYFLLKDYRERVEKKLPEAEYAEIREDIHTVCSMLCFAVSESFRGNPYRAYETVDTALKLLTDKYQCFIRETQLQNIDLFRAVDVKDKAIHDRKRVFHVPFNLRSKMSTTRYSIPGYPALYLGTSLELNCMEIGKKPNDDTVMAARFEYCSFNSYKESRHAPKSLIPFKKPLYILDVSVKPQDFLNSNELSFSDNIDLTKTTHLSLMKVKGTENPVSVLIQHPDRYLLWYPLIAACSFIRVFREDPYSPEYIIPQLVTQWVKKLKVSSERTYKYTYKYPETNNPLCGVCYFSCVSYKASEMGLNFAFPSSGSDVWTFEDLKNYCPFLAANFKITEPVFVSEYEDTIACEKVLHEKETQYISTFNTDKLNDEIEKNNGEYFVPDGEDYIPAFTFYECDNLQKITLPNSMRSIGNNAFDGCKWLKSIDIPKSLINIGEYAFEGCHDLTNITIPESVISIGDWAFEDCLSLLEITIPKSVIYIGYMAFSSCQRLKRIKVEKCNTQYYSQSNCIIEKNKGKIICGCMNSMIPKRRNIKIIGDSAFDNCIELKKITIPSNITTIGDFAFFNCENLISINIPDSVTCIGDNAFSDCISLKRIIIPDSVTDIGERAFAFCYDLDIIVPRKFENLDNEAFWGCKSVIYYDP